MQTLENLLLCGGVGTNAAQDALFQGAEVRRGVRDPIGKGGGREASETKVHGLRLFFRWPVFEEALQRRRLGLAVYGFARWRRASMRIGAVTHTVSMRSETVKG